MIDQNEWYDGHAGQYDAELFTPRGEAVKRRFSSLVSLAQGTLPGVGSGQWLEIGSGSGIYTAEVAALGPRRLTATDISQEMLRTAGRKQPSPRIGRCASDAAALPFADASFDLVWAFACLHHVADTAAAFREIHRVLKKGGGLLVLEANPLFPLNFLLAVWRPVERGMLHSWPSRWKREAAAAGLTLRGYRCGSFFPGWPGWAAGIYARVERVLENLPGVRAWGIQHYYFWQKR